MPTLYEFESLSVAQQKWRDVNRLGKRPFSIFPTARGTWAFWTP